MLRLVCGVWAFSINSLPPKHRLVLRHEAHGHVVRALCPGIDTARLHETQKETQHNMCPRYTLRGGCIMARAGDTAVQRLLLPPPPPPGPSRAGRWRRVRWVFRANNCPLHMGHPLPADLLPALVPQFASSTSLSTLRPPPPPKGAQLFAVRLWQNCPHFPTMHQPFPPCPPPILSKSGGFG